jgi:hypothetical protein
VSGMSGTTAGRGHPGTTRGGGGSWSV